MQHDENHHENYHENRKGQRLITAIAVLVAGFLLLAGNLVLIIRDGIAADAAGISGRIPGAQLVVLLASLGLIISGTGFVWLDRKSGR